MILYRGWFIGVCSNDNENTIKAFKKEISHVRLHNLPLNDRDSLNNLRYEISHLAMSSLTQTCTNCCVYLSKCREKIKQLLCFHSISNKKQFPHLQNGVNNHII